MASSCVTVHGHGRAAAPVLQIWGVHYVSPMQLNHPGGAQGCAAGEDNLAWPQAGSKAPPADLFVLVGGMGGSKGCLAS